MLLGEFLPHLYRDHATDGGPARGYPASGRNAHDRNFTAIDERRSGRWFRIRSETWGSRQGRAGGRGRPAPDLRRGSFSPVTLAAPNPPNATDAPNATGAPNATDETDATDVSRATTQPASAWAGYRDRVAVLKEQYAAIPPGQPVRLAKKTSNLFRPRPKSTEPGLDVAALRRRRSQSTQWPEPPTCRA